jgi:hypothetical protein
MSPRAAPTIARAQAMKKNHVPDVVGLRAQCSANADLVHALRYRISRLIYGLDSKGTLRAPFSGRRKLIFAKPVSTVSFDARY